jgi:hypothetical protein
MPDCRRFLRKHWLTGKPFKVVQYATNVTAQVRTAEAVRTTPAACMMVRRYHGTGRRRAVRRGRDGSGKKRDRRDLTGIGRMVRPGCWRCGARGRELAVRTRPAASSTGCPGQPNYWVRSRQSDRCQSWRRISWRRSGPAHSSPATSKPPGGAYMSRPTVFDRSSGAWTRERSSSCQRRRLKVRCKGKIFQG